MKYILRIDRKISLAQLNNNKEDVIRFIELKNAIIHRYMKQPYG